MQLAKIHRLAEEVTRRAIDVVALQEVNQTTVAAEVTPAPGYIPAELPAAGSSSPAVPQTVIREDNYAQVLVNVLRRRDPQVQWQWSWVPVHRGFGVFDEGVALLSRHPLGSVRAFSHGGAFPYDNVRRRLSLAAQVQAPKQEFNLVSSHFSWWSMPEEEGTNPFAEEWAALEPAFAQLSQRGPIVLCGDFNQDAGVRGEGYDLVMESGLWRDSCLAAPHRRGESTVHKQIAGWDSATTALRIDYILGRAGADQGYAPQFMEHCVLFADDSPQAISDHSAVAATLKWTRL